MFEHKALEPDEPAITSREAIESGEKMIEKIKAGEVARMRLHQIKVLLAQQKEDEALALIEEIGGREELKRAA